MAKYGNLTKREKETEQGVLTALVGPIIVPDLLTGQMVITERTDAPEGAKMTHDVKVNQGSGWASVGMAMFKRKNPKAAWYMTIKIDTPIIKAKLGDALWLSAFPDGEGVNMGERGDYDAESYDLIWSGSGTGKPAAGVALDDEIPF